MNVVVTGASNGIGFQLVKILAKNKGFTVVGIARSVNKLEQLEAEIVAEGCEGKFIGFPFDLSTSSFSSTLLPHLLTHISSVDLLVNNAGLLINKPFESLMDEDFDAMMNINVKAVFCLVRVLIPYFNRKAHVVNISSMGGVQGSVKFAGLSLYSASKGALAILTESMALELAGKEITVNALALGAVQTEMLEQAFPGYEAPLKPKEIATFIADFAINGSQFFNGKILPVSLSTP